MTIRSALVAVALVALVLGVGINEGWRWGFPRSILFDRENAVAWTKRVIRSDFRMYDGSDVGRLLGFVSSEGLLIGYSKDQMVEWLGPPDVKRDAVSDGPGSSRSEFRYVVGSIPEHWHAHPRTLVCYFADNETCLSVLVLEGD